MNSAGDEETVISVLEKTGKTRIVYFAWFSHLMLGTSVEASFKLLAHLTLASSVDLHVHCICRSADSQSKVWDATRFGYVGRRY